MEELESTCQLVIEHILSAKAVQAESVGLPPVLVRRPVANKQRRPLSASASAQGAVATEDSARISLIGRPPSSLSEANLARAKRSFITYIRANPPSHLDQGVEKQRQLAGLFLRFLDS
ncbi:unnamed protein product [Protopolystoma xenopodis]|uniref:Uncharacterized protein n=1 Tax=Protopolystoma xenopodis TaxID=117903 RepID=A0A3S5A4V0_9PLAT|nr:unnamed protein product [Protopolystoma xenopodis]